jgi:hypothetical protein
MPNFSPTAQPISLRLKLVKFMKFTGLQAPRVQSGVASLSIKEQQFYVSYGSPLQAKLSIFHNAQ